MGIACEINLIKPLDGAFRSGNVVSGVIKYSMNEPTTLEKITVSIKGDGQLRIRQRVNNKNNDTRVFRTGEVYVDTDEIVQEGKLLIPVGTYERPFSFKLPENIPSTFNFYHNDLSLQVICRIKYYVRIKFDKNGLLSFAKHFRKDITVLSSIAPRLATEPVMLGKKKKLTQPFTCAPSIVDIRATIVDSVIPIGGRVELQYEVVNDTNVTIKSVKSKLVEMHAFKAGYSNSGRKLLMFEDIPGSDAKTGSIQRGDSKTIPIAMDLPSDLYSIEHSNLVTRYYKILIGAKLPLPHRHAVLEIPLQIGNLIPCEDTAEPPPSYWEAMGEGNNDEDEVPADVTQGRIRTIKT